VVCIFTSVIAYIVDRYLENTCLSTPHRLNILNYSPHRVLLVLPAHV